MEVYEDLVKLLRSQADANNDEKCDLCPYEESYPPCATCMSFTQWRAANAIEELTKPKWIPVTERLPEPKTDVLVAFDDGEVWCLWQNWEAYEGNEKNPFTYAKDADWKEWHTVTHWQPLPDPPEGGDHDGP